MGMNSPAVWYKDISFVVVGGARAFYFLLPVLTSQGGRFPGEVGISSVTWSPWSQGTIPMGGCAGWWCSEPLKSQCCPYSHMKCCAFWVVLSTLTGINLEKWGWVWLGEAVDVFVAFFSSELFARPQLPHLHVSAFVNGIRCSMFLLLRNCLSISQGCRCFAL